MSEEKKFAKSEIQAKAREIIADVQSMKTRFDEGSSYAHHYSGLEQGVKDLLESLGIEP